MNKSLKLTIAGIAVAAVAWLAFGFFGIQAAFIDNKVSEENPFAELVESPIATEASTSVTASENDASVTAPPQVVTLASGSLVDHAHAGDGTISVITDGDRRFLRFEEDFAIDNGPDLNVYLVRGADAEGDSGLFDDDFIDLGDLKGNIGSQNYELDPNTDIDEYDTVVIWCVRFGVAFNAANLS